MSSGWRYPAAGFVRQPCAGGRAVFGREGYALRRRLSFHRFRRRVPGSFLSSYLNSNFPEVGPGGTQLPFAKSRKHRSAAHPALAQSQQISDRRRSAPQHWAHCLRRADQLGGHLPADRAPGHRDLPSVGWPDPRGDAWTLDAPMASARGRYRRINGVVVFLQVLRSFTTWDDGAKPRKNQCDQFETKGDLACGSCGVRSCCCLLARPFWVGSLGRWAKRRRHEVAIPSPSCRRRLPCSCKSHASFPRTGVGWSRLFWLLGPLASLAIYFVATRGLVLEWYHPAADGGWWRQTVLLGPFGETPLWFLSVMGTTQR